MPVDALDKDIYDSGRDAIGELGGDKTAEVGSLIGRGEERQYLDVGGEGTVLGWVGECEDGGRQSGEVVRGEGGPEIEYCKRRQCSQRVDLFETLIF